MASRTSTRNRWSRSYLKRVLFLDILVGVGCSGAAALIRFNDSYIDEPYYWIVPLVGIVWVAALGMSNAYERRYLGVSGRNTGRSAGPLSACWPS